MLKIFCEMIVKVSDCVVFEVIVEDLLMILRKELYLLLGSAE